MSAARCRCFRSLFAGAVLPALLLDQESDHIYPSNLGIHRPKCAFDLFDPTGRLQVYAKVDPDSIELKNGFTRDVRDIGHFGTGDLEITIGSLDDLELAKPLLLQSYKAS